MDAYLDAMDAAQYAAPEPDPPVPLVLAALGSRMLALAAERADSAHPYFVTVEHTPFARRYLGPEPSLAVEQTAVLTADVAGEGSDALIDAVVTIGDVDAIVSRVRAHLDAGADHVCVQFRAERSTDPSIDAYREISAAFAEI